jgi:catechol 2,3-dioxygenase-like lactoylglutathione lyase family enzyme
MSRSISQVALLVRDYDEAIDFFTRALAFELLEDTPLGNGKRWVRVAPPGGTGGALLLARASTAEQERFVGNQSGGRVFLFLETDDFARDRARMHSHGVRFTEEPRHEEYGTVVVFLDLYGNRWDLVGRRRKIRAREGTPMNRKFLVAWLVVFVIYMAGGMVVHGILLGDEYAATGLMRPEAEAQRLMHLMILAHVLMAGAFTWIYARGVENRPWLGQGLRYGLAVAVLFVPIYIIYYVVQPTPGMLAVRQIAYDTILTLILGATVAFLYRGHGR